MGRLSTSLIAILGAIAIHPAIVAAEYCDETTGLCYEEFVSPYEITYRIAIPEGAESDYAVALQIVASKEVGWAAIAWGGQMSNNPITVGWQNGDEAVVSSRWATGHMLPDMYSDAEYTIMPGSGANETHWTLSVLCSGCTSWSGGGVDPAGTARFAYGMSSTGPADPADPTSQFGIHQAKGGWEHDMEASVNADFDTLVEDALAGGGGDEGDSPMC